MAATFSNEKAQNFLRTVAYSGTASTDLTTNAMRWLKDTKREGGGSVPNRTAKWLALFQNRYGKTILAEPGLVGFWRMDAASGTSQPDLSSAGATGTYVNALTLNQAGAIVDGNASALFISNGTGAGDTGSYMTATVSAPGTTWSIECWVKRNGTPDSVREAIGITPLELFVSNMTGDAFTVYNGSALVTGVVNVDDNLWHHIVVVSSNADSNLKLYVDGVQDGATAGAALNLTGTVFNIGRRAAGGFTWGTFADDVALYTVALTAAQVKAHYLAA